MGEKEDIFAGKESPSYPHLGTLPDNSTAQEEISSITSKRSDFEHKVNARGPTPSDYAKYIEFETNVDTLRKKRVKRLGVKSVAHTGQRRIFFLFDRATKKFPGDLGLWMQYLEYARRQRALKKLSQILTSTLRLHPQKPELWMYAARFSLEENADMMEARSYMQRGLRFCKSSGDLWLEYTKLELLYISKITARRQILGIDQERTVLEDSQDADLDADVINLPQLTQDDMNSSEDPTADSDNAALLRLEQFPALMGAVPIAIFDSAMKQFDHDDVLAKSFYDMIDDFQVGCRAKLLGHIVQEMLLSHPSSSRTLACHVKVAVAGIPPDSPDFPPAFGAALNRLRKYMPQAGIDPSFVSEIAEWLSGLQQSVDLDPAIIKVLASTQSLLEMAPGNLAAGTGSQGQ